MDNCNREKWEQRYKQVEFESAVPTLVLEKHQYLLPDNGRALDLACGLAGNAQLLAKSGLIVDAFDISKNLIYSLRQHISNDPGLGLIHPQIWDSETDPLEQARYDVIVVSNFLQRNLFKEIQLALKPGGLLFYQTWSEACVDSTGPKNPGYRLKQGELLSLCQPMRVIHYHEDGQAGDCHQGVRNQASIIAEKSS